MKLIGTILVGPREENLEKAIKSLHDCGCEAIYALIDLVDQKSYEILQQYDCKVFTRKWDWWGMARNYLHKTVPRDTWQIFLDSDDEIPIETCQKIKELTRDSNPSVIYMPYVYCDKHGNPYGSHYRARIFPTNNLKFWGMRVHEYPEFEKIPNVFIKTPIYHKRGQKEPDRNKKYIQGLVLDLQEYPNSARITYYLGQSYMDDGQYDKAIECYEKYLSLGGFPEERMRACLYLSQLSMRQKDYQKAIEYAKKAAEESPEPRREINSQIASCLDLQEKIPEAIKALEDALIIPYPKNALLWIDSNLYHLGIYFQLVTILDKYNMNQQALEWCNKALEIEPNNSNMLYNKKISMGKLKTDIPRIRRRKPMAFFYMGQSLEDWNADIVNGKGIGGLESANVNMAKEFIKHDWDVILFTNCKDKEGVFNGIQHKDHSRIQECITFYKPDIIFSSRRYEVGSWDTKAYKVLWNHDLHYGNDPKISELMQGFDEIIFQSPFAYSVMKQAYGIPEDKVYLTRLGINMDDFKEDIPKERHHCIYASSPDRGLVRLLDFWKDIKAKVPDATLDIFYGFNNMLNVAKMQSEQAYNTVKQHVDNLIKLMEGTPGVTYRGRIGHKELAKEFLRAAVWTYPTKFLETLCITALSACAGGTVPVTSNIGALNTTVGEYGILLDEEADSPEYKAKFINEVVRLMTDDEYYQKAQGKANDNIWTRKNPSGKAFWSWEAIGEEWVSHFEPKITGKIIELGAGNGPDMLIPEIIHTDMYEGKHIELFLDNEALPFRDSSIEGMIAHQTLEHIGWRDTLKTLEGIWDVMKPGTYIEISVPNTYEYIRDFMEGKKNVYWLTNLIFASQNSPGNVHKTMFLPSSMRSVIARAGFSVQELKLANNSIYILAQKPRIRDKHWYEQYLSEKLQTDVKYSMLNYDNDREYIDGWFRGIPWEYDIRHYISGDIQEGILDIIIYGHGGCDARTMQTVPQLRKIIGNKKYNLIGVDDGSKDDTAKMMREFCDRVVVLPQRRGMTMAANAGITASISPYICMIQNDAFITDGTLEAMLNVLYTRKHIGIVSPNFNDRPFPERIKDNICEYNCGYSDSIGKTLFPIGPCMMYRKKDILYAGRHDPYIYNIGDDLNIGKDVNDIGLYMAVIERPICKYAGNNIGRRDQVTYNQNEVIRVHLSLYYIFLKYGFRLDVEFFRYWDNMERSFRKHDKHI